MPYAREIVERLGEEHTVALYNNADEIARGDIVLLLGCTKIVPKSVLDRNRHNIVVHESDLPLGRGWSPLSWQVEEGKNRIPISLFEAAEELDAGEVYFKDWIELDGTELFPEIKEKQGKKTIEMVLKFVEMFPNIKPVPQTGNPTFYRRRKMEDNRMDVNKTLADQFDKIRVSDNNKFPSWFTYRGRKYKLRIYPYE